jgi:hypothetical protein
LIKSGTTPLLVTPRELQVGVQEHQRSGLVVVAAGTPQAERWFRFPPTTDFARCMPADQQPKIDDVKKKPAHKAAVGSAA